MTGRDWFVVGARLIGVWVVYNAFMYAASFVDSQLFYKTDAPLNAPSGYLMHALFYLLLGLYLLLGTDQLAGVCYGDKGATEEMPSTQRPPEPPQPPA